MCVAIARLVRSKNYHAFCCKCQVNYMFYWIDRNQNVRMWQFISPYIFILIACVYFDSGNRHEVNIF